MSTLSIIGLLVGDANPMPLLLSPSPPSPLSHDSDPELSSCQWTSLPPDFPPMSSPRVVSERFASSLKNSAPKRRPPLPLPVWRGLGRVLRVGVGGVELLALLPLPLPPDRGSWNISRRFFVGELSRFEMELRRESRRCVISDDRNDGFTDPLANLPPRRSTLRCVLSRAGHRESSTALFPRAGLVPTPPRREGAPVFSDVFGM
mmetsp:Transcript_35106/g.65049  ORF Transcript_35106/g.65049 Transcript_35106/m.65049 type:complete len:204 (-) Transcript_35106:303-914(-)